MAKDKVKAAPPKTALPKLALLKSSKILLWRFGLGALVLACIILASFLWMSGQQETKDAFRDGRRLLIRLDNGVIEGKPLSLAMTKLPAPAPHAAAASSAPAAHPSSAASSTIATSAAAASVASDGSSAAASAADMSANTSDVIANATPVISTNPVPDANPVLIEKTPNGPLPVIADDGTKAWGYYAKAYERKGTLPMIAIVISGLGENKSVTDSAMGLPENVALSFSPYARDIAKWVITAHTAGHEVLIDLPLEPGNYPATDPGPYGLLSNKKPEENEAHLKWLMSRTTGYVGFLTPQNEGFSANADAFKALLQMLSNRGLMLVVGGEPPKSETKQMIETSETPSVVGDMLLDEDLSATAIQTRLNSLEQLAKTRGYAVGIGQAYPITIQQLNIWAAKLADDGFVLVPVTFIAHLRYS